MLNPPLSLLPKELLSYIVHFISDFPYDTTHLRRLSLADRAFTELCQAYFFKHIVLKDAWVDRIPERLAKFANILNDKPWAANGVRKIKLSITSKNEARVFFTDPTFINIVQTLAKSRLPPRKLILYGRFMFEDPILIVGQLTKTFFSQTLTVLRLTQCENVPVTFFLICPLLREVILEDVEVTKHNYDEFPDEQCFGRELPALEYLEYYKSHGLIEQIITPLPRFRAGVVLWSRLRVLKLYVWEKKEMTSLQPILDSACNTLEELYLRSEITDKEQPFLNGYVNLKDLSCLRVFAVHAIFGHGALESIVLHDINLILRTIPTSNRVTTLFIDLDVDGRPPFRPCFQDNWAGLCNEIIRISAGKTLKLSLDPFGYTELSKFHRRVLKKIASLTDYPNISIAFRCDRKACSCDSMSESPVIGVRRVRGDNWQIKSWIDSYYYM